MIEISFCELNTEEMDNAAFKNKFILETEGKYLAFINGGRISIDEVKNKIEAEKLFDYSSVLIFCAGESKDAVELQMKDLLTCYTADILGIAFDRKLLENAGKFNEKLTGLTNFELACRLTDITGQCLLVFDEIGEVPLTVTDAELFGYAYLVRRYLQKVHKYSITEQLLTGMYQIAECIGKLDTFKRYLGEMLAENQVYERIAWNTAPYAIFRGDQTCHGVLQDFADYLAMGLRDIGESVLMLEPGKIDYDYLQQYICKGFIGFQSEAFGVDFFQKLPGAKVQFWFDNPVFYKNQFSTIPGDVYILCHDENYAEFIRTYYGMKNAVHMPPGGHMQFWDARKQRPYDVIFIGKFIPETDDEFEDFEKTYYEYMIAHPDRTFSKGVQELLHNNGVEINQVDIAETLTEVKHVCQQIINHYKKKVIDTILQAGYELHVYGDSWNKYHSPWEEKLIRHPEVSVEESLLEWQKAKIGLNIMSWHKAGMTERIANIMLAGAVCLSDETTYLREHFLENEQIVLYSLEKLEELPQKIGDVLSADKWKTIAQNGYHAATAEHTWQKRAHQLNQFVENNYEWR